MNTGGFVGFAFDFSGLTVDRGCFFSVLAKAHTAAEASSAAAIEEAPPPPQMSTTPAPAPAPALAPMPSPDRAPGTRVSNWVAHRTAALPFLVVPLPLSLPFRCQQADPPRSCSARSGLAAQGRATGRPGRRGL